MPSILKVTLLMFIRPPIRTFLAASAFTSRTAPPEVAESITSFESKDLTYSVRQYIPASSFVNSLPPVTEY